VNRAARLKAIDALEQRAKQFRAREDIWPFRVPHDPLAFDPADLKPRMVLRMEWPSGAWELSAIALPSGILLYCDSDGQESRILASIKRGNPAEADGFFLERLAESRGRAFGIEMAGPPPVRIRSAIGDREFLTDVFVELLEGTAAERVLAQCSVLGADPVRDFRDAVRVWLSRVLTAPPAARRQRRLADAQL
jgi:hypothetical protein